MANVRFFIRAKKTSSMIYVRFRAMTKTGRQIEFAKSTNLKVDFRLVIRVHEKEQAGKIFIGFVTTP